MWFWPRTAPEALEELQKQSFDLILMDAQMPVMDGVQATAAIRQKERIHGRPHSHHCHDCSRHGGRPAAFPRSGMDGYISKPVHSRELFDVIESLIGLNNALVAGSPHVEA